MYREKAEKQDMMRSLEVCVVSSERVILLTVSFSMLKPCVEEVEISCLVFLSFHYLGVMSASFQSHCLHGKVCDIIATGLCGYFKGILP